MTEFAIRVLINAAALWIAVELIPDNLLSFDFGGDWWKLLAVALVRRDSPKNESLFASGRIGRTQGRSGGRRQNRVLVDIADMFDAGV